MLEIKGFAPELAPHFERLNVEWLEQFFEVEPVDARVLGDPQGEIIDHGGHVLFAVEDGDVVGTCAVKHHSDGVFELIKMGVAPRAQGRGIGRRLLEAAIAQYRAAGGRRLYLESHHALIAALRLYETAGFRHAPNPAAPSVYARGDIYMVFEDAGVERDGVSSRRVAD